MTRSNLPLAALAVAAALAASCAPVDPPAQPPGPDGGANPGPRPPLVIPPGKDPVKVRIEAAIEQVRNRQLLTTNGFWTVFHGILGMGPSLELTNPTTKAKVNALEYIAGGGHLEGLEFVATKYGVDVVTRVNFRNQGHQDQFIAEMAQWNTPADKPFRIGKDMYSFLDFVRHSQMRASVKGKQELSWAIVVIGQYLGTDISWTNADGDKLHFEDLMRYEVKESIEEAACGGTHRLFGLAWAYHLHLQKGGKTEGVWREVADRLDEHKKLARKYRNADGSLSTNFFKGRGDVPNRQLRLNTTGHTLEWLALTLTDDELKQSWVQDAANYLAVLFLEIENEEVDTGSLYHAIHGLLMYYARVYDPAWLGPNRPFMVLPPGSKVKG